MKNYQTRKRRLQAQTGQSMVEILIAMTVVTIVMVAMVSRAVEAVKSAQFARNKSLATRYAQEGVEWMRSERDQSWSEMAALLTDGVLEEYCVPDVTVSLDSITE